MVGGREAKVFLFLSIYLRRRHHHLHRFHRRRDPRIRSVYAKENETFSLPPPVLEERKKVRKKGKLRERKREKEIEKRKRASSKVSPFAAQKNAFQIRRDEQNLNFRDLIIKWLFRREN